MGNCCCKFKLLEIYRLLSQADVRVSRGSRVNCRGSRVAGRGSRVAGRGSRVKSRGSGKLSRVQKIVASSKIALLS